MYLQVLMPLPPPFDVTLVRASTLSPSVKSLVFARTDGLPFVFDAGQWVNLILPLESGKVKRAYSIASAPNRSPEFEVAVTQVEGGPGSTFLHTLEPGRSIQATGPQGFFTRSPGEAAPSLLIATGTGIAPLRSMLIDALTRGDRAPIWLLFGVRCETDILYRAELEALAAKHDNVRIEVTLSQPKNGWAGRTGYVQTHVTELFVALEALGAGAPHAYVCGLERMVGAVRHVLRKEMNIDRHQVHSERYD